MDLYPIPVPVVVIWAFVFVLFGYLAVVMNREYYRAKRARAINDRNNGNGYGHGTH